MSHNADQKEIDFIEPSAVLGLLFPAIFGVLAYLEVPGWGMIVALVWLILCLVATFAQIAPSSRAFVTGTMRKSKFTQIYTFLSTPVLDWFWNSLCDKIEVGADWRATFKAALTWKLYDRALLIAVAYPLLLLIGWWIVTGQDGWFGSLLIVRAAPLWPDRAAAFGMVALVTLSIPISKWASSSQKVLLRKISDSLPFIAVAFGGIAAGAAAFRIWELAKAAARGPAPGPAVELAGFVASGSVAVALIGTVAVAGTGAVALAVSVALVGAFAVVFHIPFALGGEVQYVASGTITIGFAMIFAVAVAVAGAVKYLDGKQRQPLARLLLTLILPALWIAVLLFLPWNDVFDQEGGNFLFLGILPLINALFDWLSYAITLTLMRRGLTSTQPLLYGAIDLGAALVLFLGLGAALTVIFATMNSIAGMQIFNMGALFAAIYTDPHAYWWLFAMVFSTILPTALHGIFSLLGAQAFVFGFLRRPVAALLRDAPGQRWKAAVAPLAVGTLWLIPFAALGLIGWVFWQISGNAIEWLGWKYFTSLRDLAAWVGAF